MWGGSLFFAACMAFQFFLAGSPQVGLGHLTLQVLVYLGALLYVFSKSAKFSLFKPAEEMTDSSD
ncbi:ADP,ATP carrier protein [Haematococcus lacustris]|uniref:ADP,ATP carrier protein n=1 Tax=Haematococcus lacustris TaxID=44745 RepID=A0A6A0AM17_HAELA|nr:ADP,ATP carrier protein [Haematococcus lacustris]